MPLGEPGDESASISVIWPALLTAHAFVAGLPRGFFTDVADAGHMVAGDRNDAFLDAAVSFLERNDLGGGG